MWWGLSFVAPLIARDVVDLGRHLFSVRTVFGSLAARKNPRFARRFVNNAPVSHCDVVRVVKLEILSVFFHGASLSCCLLVLSSGAIVRHDEETALASA